MATTVDDFDFDGTVQADIRQDLATTLEVSAEENKVIEFPESVDEPLLVNDFPDLDQYDNLGISSLGKIETEVAGDYIQPWLRVDMDNFFMRGININHGYNGNNNTGAVIGVNNEGLVQDVTYLGGTADHPEDGANSFSPWANTEDARLRFERTRDKSRGTVSHTDGNGNVGFLSHSGKNHGLLEMINCEVIDSCNNGIYSSYMGPTGRVHVNGGIWKENYGAALRAAGNGTLFENAYIEVDMRNSQRSESHAQPGFRTEIKNENCQSEETMVRNCHFRFYTPKTKGFRIQQSSKFTTVKDCYFWYGPNASDTLGEIQGEGEYKYAPPSGFDDYDSVLLDNIHVSGPGADDVSLYIGVNRDGVTLRDCVIPGGTRGPGSANLENFNNLTPQEPIEEPNSLPALGHPPEHSRGLVPPSYLTVGGRLVQH